MKHFRFYATTLGLLVCALCLYKLYTLWDQPRDAYWNPAHLALPLDAAKDRFEILVQGKPLARAVDEKRVSIAVDGSILPLASSEVTVRVNDYDRQRTARIPVMLWLAATAGGAFVLFVIGLVAPLIGVLRPHGLVDLHLTA
jgi:hypothetical protein